MTLFIGIFTFILILISCFLVLVVLAQKAKNDGGMGAALGGGAAEATFGAETGNVLTNATIKAAIAFFVLCLMLYLGHIYVRSQAASGGASELPTFDATTAPVGVPGDQLPPVTPPPVETTPAPVPPTAQP